MTPNRVLSYLRILVALCGAFPIIVTGPGGHAEKKPPFYVGSWHGDWKCRSPVSTEGVPSVQSGEMDLKIDPKGKLTGTIQNYLGDLKSRVTGSVEKSGSFRFTYSYQPGVLSVARMSFIKRDDKGCSGNFRCYADGEVFALGVFEIQKLSPK